MVRSILSLIFSISIISSFSQTVYSTYPKILLTDNDSFQVKYSFSTSADTRAIGKRDSMNFNTDGMVILNGELQPVTATIIAGKESVTLTYKNKPYGQYHYVTVNSPKGKTVIRMGFQPSPAIYTVDYINANKGNVQVQVPETYELANVIWLLSPSGQRASDIVKEGAYYEKVLAYFKPYRDHALLKKLDFPDSIYASKYYEFRENSVCYTFNKDNKLQYNGPYYYVYGEDYWERFQNLFTDLLPLVEDFASKSGFRKFYLDNKDHYHQLISRQKDLLPVKNMWAWLETQFPRYKYNAYNIIFSPLIKSSHSTQNFSFYSSDGIFRETVMFVCGPDRFDDDKTLSEKKKEGLMSGIVFTEIDHNYVNPTSNRYRATIDSIFSNRSIWASSGGGNNYYRNAVSVFNEYMTHSVFCLWVLDNFNGATADFIIKHRESLMVERRFFIHFREFNRKMIELRNKHKDKVIADLYPALLQWCKTQQ
jgi:hypothetical protein